jgi:hypothetical protein
MRAANKRTNRAQAYDQIVELLHIDIAHNMQTVELLNDTMVEYLTNRHVRTQQPHAESTTNTQHSYRRFSSTIFLLQKNVTFSAQCVVFGTQFRILRLERTHPSTQRGIFRACERAVLQATLTFRVAGNRSILSSYAFTSSVKRKQTIKNQNKTRRTYEE